MRRIGIVTVVLLHLVVGGVPVGCSGGDDGDPPVDSYGMCPTQWRAYPHQPAGTDIRFPDDEGAHYVDDLSMTMEWWYTVYHLTTPQGRTFSIMTTFFMPQLDIAYRPFNITDVDTGEMFDSDEWGTLVAGTEHLELAWSSEVEGEPDSFFRTRRDSRGELVPFGYEQHVHHLDEDSGRTQSLHLLIDSVKSPYIVAGDGFITIGDSGDSWYYSLTHLEVSGELELNGEVFEVSGVGWLDHQWGPFMLSPLSLSRNSYEWMALHLDNGDEYMVSTIFDATNQTHREEGFGSVGWKLADCSQGMTLTHTIEALGFWQQPESGRYYSHGWHLVVPDTGLDVTVTPVIEDQTVGFFHTSFYEGRSEIVGTIHGEPVTGLAFAELVHHYQPPEVSIVRPVAGCTASASALLPVSWTVGNLDDALPLTYVVTASDGSGSQTVCPAQSTQSCQADVGDFSGPVTIRVTASSVDGVISGDATVVCTISG